MRAQWTGKMPALPGGLPNGTCNAPAICYYDQKKKKKRQKVNKSNDIAYSGTKKRKKFMAKNSKKIPHFSSEAAEEKFWEKQDSSTYVDWTRAQRVRFVDLKPSTTAISIRLPTDLLEQIKTSANRKDVPYQSLIKLWLAEKMASQSQQMHN